MKHTASLTRKTKETSIDLCLSLRGSGKSDINTGIGFLDHMLEQWVFHGLIDLNLHCKGDLDVDTHHTTEDIAIALGQAFLEALGDKTSIRRYGSAYLPMDETLVRVVLDISGRPEFVFQGDFTAERIGSLETQMISHFFKSFAMQAQITLHMSILYGSNDHHKCEALFKAFAQSLRTALQLDEERKGVPSTKGIL